MLAHRDLAAEAGAAGDLGHGQVGAFEEFLGCGDALVEEPAQGCGAGLRREVAGEGAGGHAGVGGQVGDGERFVQMAQGVFAYGGEGVGVAVGSGCGAFDELGLGAGAERGGDHRAGDGGGGLGSVGAADEVQAEVDSGGRTRGGPDVVVLDEQGVRDDGDLGVAGAEPVDEVPVGDGAATVEEAGLGEGEGAAAEGGDGGAAGVGAAEGVKDGGGGRVEFVEAGDDDQVGAVEPGQGAVGVEGEAAAQGHGGSCRCRCGAVRSGGRRGRCGRSPQTSVMTETSKARMPGKASRATR
ncbi:hypothetical protein GCM10020256_32370 [Streptomyces thermocoprophilus]